MHRIDYDLMPLETYSIVNECRILPATISDHCPILIQITKSEGIRGPGLWNFNTNHLQSKEFIDKVNETTDFANHRYISLNSANKWEMIKLDIRQISFQHANWVRAKGKLR